MGRGRGDNKTSTFPANLGGKPRDKWKGVDISDLTKQYPEAVFRSFPGPLKKKIHKAKQCARRSNNTDRSISELSTQMGQIQTLLTQDRSRSDDISQITTFSENESHIITQPLYTS
eukprot:10941464-Ditylum_brightwellii.AAC.1